MHQGNHKGNHQKRFQNSAHIYPTPYILSRASIVFNECTFPPFLALSILDYFLPVSYRSRYDEGKKNKSIFTNKFSSYIVV
jgi:hypothetical protein